MEQFQPELWHDLFVATAGAASALAGLLFVALSLHMRYIATRSVYRDMARGSLIGLVMALVMSLLVLVRQPLQWLAVEAGFAGFAYLAVVGGHQLLSLRRKGWRIARESTLRSIGGYVLGLVGLANGVAMLAQIGPGLYVLAAIVVAIILWSLWNAWVLVIGVADEEIRDDRRSSLAQG